MGMEQKLIEISGIQLAFIEQNKMAANIIFFIHGNSGSSRTWYKQFSSPLFASYRLIAFDLPAHGQSSASNNPEQDYSPVATGEIIAKAIKHLAGNKTYVLVGFSYGTNVIAEALNHDIQPVGIVLSASCIIGADYGMDKAFKAGGTTIFFRDDNNEEEVKKFFTTALISSGVGDACIYTEDFFSVRSPFRSTLLQSVIDGKVSDEIDFVKRLKIPVQVFFGLEDNLLNIHYLDDAPLSFRGNTIHKLPGAGHFLQSDQPEIFSRLLAEYLEERFTAGHV